MVLHEDYSSGLQSLVVSRNQILQLLGHAGLRRIFATRRQAGIIVENDDDEDLAGGYGRFVGRHIRHRKSSKALYPPVPSKEGRRLMDSGTFGSNEYYRDMLRKRKQRLSRRLMSRELGLDSVQDRRGNRLISQVCIHAQGKHKC